MSSCRRTSAFWSKETNSSLKQRCARLSSRCTSPEFKRFLIWRLDPKFIPISTQFYCISILVGDQKILAQAFGYRAIRTFAERSLGQLLLFGEGFLHPLQSCQPATIGCRTGKFDCHVQWAQTCFITFNDP